MSEPTRVLPFSVIVVNYRARELLSRCLESLALSKVEHEAIVVDNASRDGSAELVRERHPGARLIVNERNLGFAHACNQGLAARRGRHALLLNPDAAILNDVLGVAGRELERRRDLGVLGARILDEDGRRQLSARAFPSHATAFFHRYSLLTKLLPGNRGSRAYLGSDLPESGAPVAVDWVSGAAMVLREEAIAAVGGFDERFFLYAEDTDLCLSVRRAGFAVAYAPEAVVVHRIGGSSRKARPRALLERHRSMWRFYAKHYARRPLVDLTTCAGIVLRGALMEAKS
ncbi:glycosyltransferase family 2 protein [bacterium]|nr:glycosyltransferase family 2 protein [bacterium]